MQCIYVRLQSVACPAVQYFSTLPKKRHDFHFRKTFLNIKCVLIFPITFVGYISHSKKNGARYDQNVYWSSCKVAVFFPDFNETWIFLANFRKVLKYQILIKSVPWEPNCFLRTDRHMTKLVVAFFFAILRTRLDTDDRATGYGNLRVNVMLCVTAGGNKLPPFVILNRKPLTVEHFCEGIIFCALKMRGWHQN
jgi:hypothetical protein